MLENASAEHFQAANRGDEYSTSVELAYSTELYDILNRMSLERNESMRMLQRSRCTVQPLVRPKLRLHSTSSVDNSAYTSSVPIL